MTDVLEQAQALSPLISQLPKGQQSFATSLCYQALQAKKKLSAKQAEWVSILLEKAKTPPAPPPSVDLGVDVSGIVALFATAGSKLKWPTITLQLGDKPVVMNRAGKTAKYPGSVNVKVRRPNGEYDWLGRVLEDGTWMPGRMADDYPILEDFLVQFALAPAQVAAEYGKKTGRCCFCNLKLSDARSLFVGYGKTCAGHYALPYPKMSEVA